MRPSSESCQCTNDNKKSKDTIVQPRIPGSRLRAARPLPLRILIKLLSTTSYLLLPFLLGLFASLLHKSHLPHFFQFQASRECPRGMVGPERPQFVLFGSSIVQFSFSQEGWGAILADLYARKADIVLRGYSGWNSRRGVKVLDKVFPKDAAVQPSLVIVYFGGNDAVRPSPNGLGPHVPLPEYIENMRKIALHLKSLSPKTRIIFLGAPPINEQQMHERLSSLIGDTGRTNEGCRIYSEACMELSRELDVKAIDLWTAIQQRDDWLNTSFTDGIHLSSEGSKVVVKEIMKVLREAEWEPSLHWKSLPIEFEDEFFRRVVTPKGKIVNSAAELELSKNEKWL